MGFPVWEPASRCSGSATPGAQALMRWIMETYGDKGAANWGIYNCFGGETKVLTRDGWSRIDELSGTEVDLLTSDGAGPGRWVTAPIKSFGTQELRRVVLSRQGRTKEIFATADHRWFASKDYGGAPMRELTTDELVAGDKLASKRPQSVATRTSPSPVGVQAGLIYGDGTRASHDSRIVLCGEKNTALAAWFSSAQSRTTLANGDVLITGLPRSWKDAPRLDEGTSYLYGWLAGHFAADGRVTSSGSPTLYSADQEALEYVRLVALRLGIVTGEVIGRKRQGYGDEPTMLFETSIDPRTVDSTFFLIPEHRERWNSAERKEAPRWKVERVEETDRVETVYCAVVPETENFVIDEFILTGNCRSVRGGSTTSLHGEGRALDVGFPLGDKDADRLRDRLLKVPGRLGIQAIIYERRIYSRLSPEGRPYTGVAPHFDHLHIELTREAAQNLTYATVKAVLTPKVRRAGSRTLREGHKGADVRWLQRKLGVGVDGHFGPKTKAAAQKFEESYSKRFPQSKLRLKADGVVGKNTWKALGVRPTY